MKKNEKIMEKLINIQNKKNIKKAKELCMDILFKESKANVRDYAELFYQELKVKIPAKEISKWQSEFIDNKLEKIKEGCMTVYFDECKTIKEVQKRINEQECIPTNSDMFLTKKTLMRWGKEWSKRHTSTDKEWSKGK